MIDPTDASALLRTNASWTKSLDASIGDVATDFVGALDRVSGQLDETIVAAAQASRSPDHALDSSVQHALLAAADTRAAIEGARGFSSTFSALEVTSTARDRVNAGWRELADSAVRVEIGDVAGARLRLERAHGELLAARGPVERARHYADPMIAKDPRLGYFDDTGRRLEVGSRPPELTNPSPVLDDARHAQPTPTHADPSLQHIDEPGFDGLHGAMPIAHGTVERLTQPRSVEAHARLTAGGQKMSLGSSFRIHATISGVERRDDALPIARALHQELGGTVGLRGIGIDRWQVGVLDAAPRLDPAQRAKLAGTRTERVQLAGMDAVFLPHGPEYLARS